VYYSVLIFFILIFIIRIRLNFYMECSYFLYYWHGKNLSGYTPIIINVHNHITVSLWYLLKKFRIDLLDYLNSCTCLFGHFSGF
jgi:hypothetical protein